VGGRLYNNGCVEKRNSEDEEREERGVPREGKKLKRGKRRRGAEGKKTYSENRRRRDALRETLGRKGEII